MLPSCPLPSLGWAPGSSHRRRRREGFRSSQLSSPGLPLSFRVRPSAERPSSVRRTESHCSPSLEVLSPSAYPRTGQRPCMPKFASLERSAPPGFLNLLTLWSAPCLLTIFQARSALGVFPSKPSSSHAAVHRLRCHYPLDVRNNPLVFTDEPPAFPKLSLRSGTATLNIAKAVELPPPSRFYST
jgi:hypothetical protein